MEGRKGRSLALEEAYVHDVYHQMGGQETAAPWPRVLRFLNQLEPGSIVCDVGCGSGKYLSVNPSVFKLGVDRCIRLAEAAREEHNQVLVCDNLALPFRDESFDAVLSVAVVHHFATTERRVGALKELARILRIGGRLVISVWAMEQRNRKFESQDVLVPWHRPQTLSTPSLEITPTTATTSDDDDHSHNYPYNNCTHASDSDSCPSKKLNKDKKKSKQKQIETVSPSSSSLSSPNETCYSFVRKALQKLAGSKRNNTRSRPWFLDSWTSCTWKEPPPRRYDPEGCEDIQDLPIELRRLEDDRDLPSRRQTFACTEQVGEQQFNHKSKSLTDIINYDQQLIVRSQSSAPSLEKIEAEDKTVKEDYDIPVAQKPRLVKQKKSVCEEDIDSEERDQATDMKDLVQALPEFKISGCGTHKKGNVFKQSSMNEELMSTDRLKEKERVKQNIQKQASLNEELIFNYNGKLDTLKDTLFSTSTAKRFQILKNGLTNKLKNSTTGIEKVAGASIKNGFVRMFQGWTSTEIAPTNHQAEEKSGLTETKKEAPNERRHSKEDGSDSSKDSSLQSDTSVDSEDSFASVIFIPKTDQGDQLPSTNTSPTNQSNPASPQPTSPKIKFPPPISPKLKNPPHYTFGMPSHPSSPKIKHMNQIFNTPNLPSPKLKYFPKATSPRTYPDTNAFFSSTSLPASNNESTVSSPVSKTPQFQKNESPLHGQSLNQSSSSSPTIDQADSDFEKSSFYNPPLYETTIIESECESVQSSSTTIFKGSSHTTVAVETELVAPKEHRAEEFVNRKEGRTKTVSRNILPLVRRSSCSSGGDASRPIPRLLSLEIFNPEIDDLDSDSSGVSSPDSVESVISIKNDEEANGTAEQRKDTLSKDDLRLRTSGVGAELSSLIMKMDQHLDEIKSSDSGECYIKTPKTASPLLEAAAGVAYTLEETVDTVIQSSPQSKRKQITCEPWKALHDDLGYFQKSKITKSSESTSLQNSFDTDNATNFKLSLDDSMSTKMVNTENNFELKDRNNRWDEECRKHLAEFAEKLSEKLLAEIDKYREQSSGSQPISPVVPIISQNVKKYIDPYLSRLSEDLQDLSRMSIELKEENNHYISRMYDNANPVQNSQKEPSRIKGEGAPSIEKHVEQKKEALLDFTPENSSREKLQMKACLVRIESFAKSSEDLTGEEVNTHDDGTSFSSSNTIPKMGRGKEVAIKNDVNENKFDNQLSTDFKKNDETVQELCNESDTESSGSEGKRKSSLFQNKGSVKDKYEGRRASVDDHLKLEVFPFREALRKPSISIEMLDIQEEETEKDECNSDYQQFNVGLAVDQSEIGDISERTGSSSDGSRSGSRRETIQIFDSGSTSSLRPGLSIESSDAGDVSDKGGSDSSRDSRRDTMSLSEMTSCSQNSLLRPGNSIESSDTGEVSERTGSDLSRKNTSSAGKTPSTTSFTSDRASDCSKDARFADRRMARCDGRSSSEETPLSKSCHNKLIRQGASTQEPTDNNNKLVSSETSLSGSTSQDSLMSDTGGGAITLHRYYHVFKEGELDQLIETYVENLHIVSSYYDHANWCVIAEKVQVWTI